MREKVLTAAVELFAKYGYHAATMRDIADIAGIRAASIYYHYANKQALLVEIMETHMLRLNGNLEQIISKQDTIQQRLYEAIANHIRHHTTFKSEFFIIDTEIRALEGENLGKILALRDKYERLLQKLLHEGMEQGILRQTDVKVSSYAIIACRVLRTLAKSVRKRKDIKAPLLAIIKKQIGESCTRKISAKLLVN